MVGFVLWLSLFNYDNMVSDYQKICNTCYLSGHIGGMPTYFEETIDDGSFSNDQMIVTDPMVLVNVPDTFWKLLHSFVKTRILFNL